MSELALFDIVREALWVLLLTAAPLLLVGTLVGVVVALVQALTTLQEATLTFVPKMVAMFVTMVLFLPFMLTTLAEFTRGLFARIADGG